MKKVLIFTLTLILIGSVFVSSIFAATPAISPLYGGGLVEHSGWWSPVTYSISGTFGLYDPDVSHQIFSIPSSSPWRIYRDDRDEDGLGVVFYILEFTVEPNFAFIDDYTDFYYVFDSGQFDYDTIQIVLREYDTDGDLYLNDFNILGTSHLTGEPLKKVLYHDSDGYDPASDVYLIGSGLYFGEQYRYFAPSAGWSLAFRQRFMYDFFSGYQTADGIYYYAGLFKPVVYSENWSGDDPSVPSPPTGGGSDDSPAGGFTAFMRLIIEAFKDLLMIEFFGGFFSLADILGVVVSFALLVLFVKWFAGG